MLQLMANPGSPGAKFTIGNLDTLKNLPEKYNINVAEELLAFYKTHYSANLMSLVIMGKESLE